MRARKIKSIKKNGCLSTMDIEVDNESHLFYGNGLATSNSHAVAYAVNSYWSAYYKANSLQDFYVSWLTHAVEKQDPHQETYELCTDARSFNFKLKTPKISKFQENFNAEGGIIHFGFKNIKSLTGKNGDKAIDVIRELDIDPQKLTFLEALIYLTPKINSTCFKTLCSIGFFRGISETITRNAALYQYEVFKTLTKSELAWVTKNYPEKKWPNIIKCFEDLAPTKKEGGGTFKESRKQIILNELKMLENPPYSLEDDVDWVIEQEQKFLGCPVSMTKIETSNTSNCNTTCKEIQDGKCGKNLTLAATIIRVASHKIKKDGPNKNKEMSFLTVEDQTGSLDSVVLFPDSREENKYSLFEGNSVIIKGTVEREGSFIVNQLWEI